MPDRVADVEVLDALRVLFYDGARWQNETKSPAGQAAATEAVVGPEEAVGNFFAALPERVREALRPKARASLDDERSGA